ncbi:cytochrome C [Pseudorhodobacter sp.]|jgi:cytochrome c|uniref:c-type cytochrome n=1 Tax=Pseudorhodobacter sp. TaxID=1934400 RepID=UPI002AFF4C7B|nr:cytochrome C [Pseudorhodobacter sp.]
MKLSLIATAALLALTAPAFAGDAVKGEKEFKKCKACHEIVADDGTAIVKGGKTGPNLYGIIGRHAGAVEGFKYSDVMREAGEKGLIWEEDVMAEYLPDPTKFLEDFSGDPKGKSLMTFKLKKGGDDVAAYLASVVPAAN